MTWTTTSFSTLAGEEIEYIGKRKHRIIRMSITADATSLSANIPLTTISAAAEIHTIEKINVLSHPHLASNGAGGTPMFFDLPAEISGTNAGSTRAFTAAALVNATDYVSNIEVIGF